MDLAQRPVDVDVIATSDTDSTDVTRDSRYRRIAPAPAVPDDSAARVRAMPVTAPAAVPTTSDDDDDELTASRAACHLLAIFENKQNQAVEENMLNQAAQQRALNAASASAAAIAAARLPQASSASASLFMTSASASATTPSQHQSAATSQLAISLGHTTPVTMTFADTSARSVVDVPSAAAAAADERSLWIEEASTSLLSLAEQALDQHADRDVVTSYRHAPTAAGGQSSWEQLQEAAAAVRVEDLHHGDLASLF